MSDAPEQDNNAQSPESPETTKKEEFEQDPRLGEWFPQDPGPYFQGTLPWHPYVSLMQREAVTEKLVKVVLDPNRFVHHRLPELIWFARQLEQQLYSAANSKNEYFLTVERRLPFMERIVRTHSEWSDLAFVEGLFSGFEFEMVYLITHQISLF